MRVHIDPQTKQILGYYPEDWDYPNLPDESELHTITDEEHRDAVAANATHWTDTGHEVRVPDPVPLNDQATALAARVDPILAKAAGISPADLRQAALDFLHPEEWQADKDYYPGEHVTYQGKEYVALADVGHHHPDDVYAPDGSSGGWQPL